MKNKKIQFKIVSLLAFVFVLFGVHTAWGAPSQMGIWPNTFIVENSIMSALPYPIYSPDSFYGNLHNTSDSVVLYQNDQYFQSYSPTGFSGNQHTNNFLRTATANQKYDIVEVNDGGSACSSLSYDLCILDSSFVSTVSFFVIDQYITNTSIFAISAIAILFLLFFIGTYYLIRRIF